MFPMAINFVIKAVVDGEFEPGRPINLLHLFYEIGSMAIFPVVPLMTAFGQEEPGMDHLVKKGLKQVVVGSELEQLLGQSNSTKGSPSSEGILIRAVTYAGAESHPGGPF